MSQYQVLKGQSPLRTWKKVLSLLAVLSAAFCPPVAAIAQPVLLDIWLDKYEHGIEFNLGASTGPSWTLMRY
jgi:hypothetical protein